MVSALVAAMALSGCTSSPAGEASTSTLMWEGELRILPGDTLFMPCGIRRAYRIAGPGLDSLAHRYAGLMEVPGQWIKAWCNGYVEAGAGRADDSVLIATSYIHMDAQVSCMPVPVDTLAGSYWAATAVPQGQHTERLEFMPDGQALIITSAPGLYEEVDGHWGLDSDGDVVFREEQGRFSFYYGYGNGTLVRPIPSRGMEVNYRRTGPADGLAGAHGRVVRMVAATANAMGIPLEAGTLRSGMPLDSLFPDPGSQAALKAAIVDTLGLDQGVMDRLWKPGVTVGSLTTLMRARMRTRPGIN